MEVPSLGSNWSCSCQPTPKPRQCQIRAVSVTYTTAHGKKIKSLIPRNPSSFFSLSWAWAAQLSFPLPAQPSPATLASRYSARGHPASVPGQDWCFLQSEPLKSEFLQNGLGVTQLCFPGVEKAPRKLLLSEGSVFLPHARPFIQENKFRMLQTYRLTETR